MARSLTAGAVIRHPLLIVFVALVFGALARAQEGSIVYEGGDGPGKGRHVVFISGDEEYRSEEGLPMLAKILSARHGFKSTVLFAVDPDGTINPDDTKSLPGAAALDSADAIVMLIRFRAWPDEQMKHFVDAVNRGVPIVALRTSTHPFKFGEGSYKSFNDFGKRVIGEGWVSHWGKHKSEATRGVIEPSAKDDPILRGVSDVFGDSDVYEAYPPPDAKILLRGQVLKGMKPDDPPAGYTKKRATDKVEQPVNDPMMPVAWTRIVKNEAGKENKILATTMGAATDLQSEGLRRLIVNGVYWCLGMDVPARADVTYVGDYKPTMYGFKGAKKGVKPSDHAMKNEATAAPPRLDLKPGDHIAIIGNALADRMQHHGHLETLIQAKFPKHDLVVRNLAFAGDEINFRHRSANFGSPDDWLTKTKADVIFAMFGFNESFKGEAGLPAFKQELEKWLKHTLAQNYSGRGPPRIVLFSPIANEKHRDPNYPDPAKNNANIALYTKAMAEVAAARGVPFVDLLEPSNSLYADAARRGESLTVNGLHLTEAGDKLLAPIMFKSLFGESPPAGDHEKLRAAVNEKSRHWHARYRTVDGYNVYGGRSKLSFPSSQPGKEIDNYHVMQEEMTQRDVLTANRDKLVWATARGESYVVDDSNLPPTTPVPTNKPGPGPEGTHVFLSGEAAIAKMKPHKGLKVNLFASEEQYPELVNPVQMAWDTKGRLWVSAWLNYPSRPPTSTVGDKLLVFEDTDGDGKADKRTIFLDDLNCPTGFQFYKDGVLVMQAPDLWFVRDTDNDGKGDWKERILMGMDSADSHHTTNSMCLEPGGAVYLSDGVFHRTQVETHDGVVRNNDAAIYRFEPRTGRFETYIAYGFANPHGRVFDYWGNDLVTDATGNHTYWGPAISGRLDYPNKHKDFRQFWNRPSRPSPGTGLLTSRHFPAEFQGNLLNLNVIDFQGIYRVKCVEDGSGLTGEKLDDLISSDDPNFRPTAVNVGPDGAIYFADWHNPVIGHMQHHLRDPSRDHAHGRIYRITHESRPLMKSPMIDGQPIVALLELLKEPENQTRELAKLELDKHDSAKVIAAVKKWAAALDRKDPAYEHHMLEVLWLYQWHNVIDRELLGRMLESPELRARAQAVRVLCYWRDRVPDVMTLLAKRAADENPRVRLEAIRAASFFRSSEATDIALAALKHPTDYYLDYVLFETLRQLEPHWREAILSGKPVAANNPAGFEYLIRNVSTADLLKFPRGASVAQVLLSRADVLDADRHKALSALADARKTARAAALLDALDTTGDAAAKANVVRLLPQLTPKDLKPLRARLSALTAQSNAPAVRQHAWAALATADESFDAVWAEASGSSAGQVDLVSAVPLVYDPFIRGRAYEKVLPLVTTHSSAPRPAAGPSGRFVRITLPRKGRLVLGEVQVVAGGKNVAPAAKATQSTTVREFVPKLAIDGKIENATPSRTRTHLGNGDFAWWELDLGEPLPIERIVVWDGPEDPDQRGDSIEGFALAVLDADRRELFTRHDNTTRGRSATIEVSPNHAPELRRAAIRAAASINREHAKTFDALAGLIERGQELTTAVAGLRALPAKSLDPQRCGDVATAIVKWARAIPPAERTSPEYLSTVQFAESIVTMLPPARAAEVLKELRDVRVAMFSIKSVREQMRYDTPRLVVEAGKPFEITFENTDMMPHNLVVVRPGSRERVGKAAQTMKSTQLDEQGRSYVPRSDDVLAATKLLEAGQWETLKLIAPAEEGEYNYVCTYPEHWPVMWGRLIVTSDIDRYLREHPDTAAPPAPTAKVNGHMDH